MTPSTAPLPPQAEDDTLPESALPETTPDEAAPPARPSRLPRNKWPVLLGGLLIAGSVITFAALNRQPGPQPAELVSVTSPSTLPGEPVNPADVPPPLTEVPGPDTPSPATPPSSAVPESRGSHAAAGSPPSRPERKTVSQTEANRKPPPAQSTQTPDPLPRVRDPFVPSRAANSGSGSAQVGVGYTPVSGPAPAVTPTPPVRTPAPQVVVTATPAVPPSAPAPVTVPRPVTPRVTAEVPVTLPSPAVTITPSAAQPQVAAPRPVVIPAPSPAITLTPASPPPAPTVTVLPAPDQAAPVPVPVPAPVLNRAEAWVQAYHAQYVGSAQSEGNVVAILNTREGPVYAPVGEAIPGTDATVLGRTPDGKTLKVQVGQDVARLPLHTADAETVQPTPSSR
ncbi:hypothetical protein [Deinococcus aluminii]|uniref:Uncharacterized protein n=1 Tax=Deinococcus aluminii TaxID=1656885 RepID=A0ABP9XF11_9DEIO